MNCPHCDAEIDAVNYSVDAREWGTCMPTNGGFHDHESDDNEWAGQPSYTCPECDEEVSVTDFGFERTVSQVVENSNNQPWRVQ